MRGVQALAPEQGANATSRILGSVGLRQNPLLVLGCEVSALGAGDDLGVGAVSDPLTAGGRAARRRRGRPASAPAALPPRARRRTLRANIAETLLVPLITEQGGKDIQHEEYEDILSGAVGRAQ